MRAIRVRARRLGVEQPNAPHHGAILFLALCTLCPPAEAASQDEQYEVEKHTHDSLRNWPFLYPENALYLCEFLPKHWLNGHRRNAGRIGRQK